MSRPEEDRDLSIAEAFVEEMMTKSVDTGIDFHFMRFLMRVDIPDGHDQMIACVRKALEFWPRKLPSHHRQMAEELIDSLECKKALANVKAAAVEVAREFNETYPQSASSGDVVRVNDV